MKIKFIPVEEKASIPQLAQMAEEIWHEYWPSIIGADQTDYMINTFQSVEAIERDIQEKGYEYWFLEDEGRIVGYTGGRVENDTNRFFISKIYLYSTERGKGFASQVFTFYENLCRERNLQALYLTVNKNNELALRAYRAKGFGVLKEVLVDIGEGFFMDDYIMEKRV